MIRVPVRWKQASISVDGQQTLTYTETTPSLSIEEVRSAVKDKVDAGVTDGQVVTYYAMVFKDHRITYYDENNVSLGQDEVRSDSTNKDDAAQDYTVNMGYTVQDDTHHFEGWNVREGGSNIKGYAGGIYQNTDDITISGDVKFGVNAPAGHWFIFHENGKGATYNAPQFVHSQDKPVKPTDSSMKRNGYRFGGWFASKKEADQTSGGTQYDFTKKLTDKTEVYARWIPNTTAGYTVIIWKENVTADGYDFERAIHLTGTVGSTINAVSQQGSGNNAYARISGTNYRYDGFHLKSHDSNT